MWWARVPGHFSNFNDNTDLPKKIMKIVKGEKF